MSIQIKLALRHLIKSKISSITNLFGLAIGLAVMFLISIWVQHELTFNHEYRKLPQLYLVISKAKEDLIYRPISPFPKPNEIAYQAFPEIENSTSLVRLEDSKLTKGGNMFRAKGLASTLSIFEMFNLTLIKGTLNGQTNSSKSIFLTEDLARKLFGTIEVIGMTIDFTFEHQQELEIVGIVRSPSSNTSIQFEFIVPYFIEKSWGRMPLDFLLLEKNANLLGFNRKFKNVGGAGFYYGANGLIELESAAYPLSDVYFKSDFSGFDHGNVNYVIIMATIGLIILVASFLNYLNLASSRLMDRLKDIGIRKLNGARDTTIFFEFFIESLIYFISAWIVSAILSYILFPAFIKLTGLEVRMDKDDLSILLMLWFLISLTLACLSSFLIPKILSGQNILSLMKGTIRIDSVGSFKERLMVLQISVSVTCIALALLINEQFKFMINSNPGYEKENIIRVNLLGPDFTYLGKENRESQLSYIDAALSSTSYIVDYDRGDFPTTTTLFNWRISPDFPSVDIPTMSVGNNFFKLFGLTIVQGEAVTRSGPVAVLNESAIRMFGITNPIGHQIENSSWGKFTILGVVKDFNFESTGIPIKPLVVVCQPFVDRPILAKIAKGKTQEALQFLAKLNAKVNPGLEFQYQFLDNEFEKLFKRDQVISRLFIFAAVISLIVSMIGLFSFMLLLVKGKTKEIGIRKVFGASATQIIWLMFGLYGKRMLIAIVIGTISYFSIANWYLDNFSMKVDLSLWLVIYSASIVAIISIVIVAFQTMKTTSVNPTISLRID